MTLLPVNHCFHRIRILIISDGLVTGADIPIGETVVNFVNISSQDAEEIFLNFKEEHPKKQIGQSKLFDITNRFWNKVLQIANIQPEKQIAQISKKELSKLIEPDETIVMVGLSKNQLKQQKNSMFQLSIS